MNLQRRRFLAASTMGGVALLLARLPADAAPRTQASDDPRASDRQSPAAREAANDGRHDFDFYIGRWQVQARRLKQRFVGSNDWEEYEATDESRPILGGLGIVDDFRSEHFGGDFRGMALHLFNPKTRQWSNYWASNRTGALDPPLVGTFEDGLGTFYGFDVDGDRPVKVRYIWSGITEASVKWEQAFSIDDGRSWETNAVFLMTRIDT